MPCWWTLYQIVLIICRFTAESSRELRRNSSWGNKRQVSMFLIFLFKLLTQFPFVSYLSISILSPLPFSILSLLPLHHPFFLFWSILCPPKIKTSIYYILFTNGTFFCILTYLFFNNAFYKLEKTKFWCLSSNLSYPEPWGLEETMAPFLNPLSSTFPHFP